ncbi:MAG: PD40 domain-containing protein [Bacteroidetes bacterium]|nr:PD40 domain-containing protein [Bacteroidota bacterium]
MRPFFPRAIAALLCVFSFAFVSCKSSTSPNNDGGQGWSGTLIYDIPSADGEIGIYDFANRRETVAFSSGRGPSWSPSGLILYEEPSDVSPRVNWKIATRARNGTAENILLDSKAFSLSVSKSPKMSRDGKTICFNYWYDNVGGPDLYTASGSILMQSDGTLIGGLDSVFDGSWMPDGSIVFSATVDELDGERTFYQDGLYRLSSDFSQFTAVGSGLVKPKHPACSPDGKRIAFAMNGHIWMINADGSGLRQVTTGSKEESHPCWSPDGKFLACMSFGTFEVSYYTAIAVVPTDIYSPIDMTNESPYWIRDAQYSSQSSEGRRSAYTSISWK